MRPSTERGCPCRSTWPDKLAAEFARTVLAEQRERERCNPAWSGDPLRPGQPRSAANGGPRYHSVAATGMSPSRPPLTTATCSAGGFSLN